jgi:hypothetical protein
MRLRLHCWLGIVAASHCAVSCIANQLAPCQKNDDISPFRITPISVHHSRESYWFAKSVRVRCDGGKEQDCDLEPKYLQFGSYVNILRDSGIMFDAIFHPIHSPEVLR